MNIHNVPTNILYAMLGIVGILVIATIICAIIRRLYPQKNFDELVLRIYSWWVMAAVFLFAMSLNPKISLVFMAFVSFLALKEYFSIIPTRRADRRVLFWAYLAIPVQTYFIMISWYGMFIVFIPIYMFILIPTQMILIGETKGFLKAAGTIHWGLVVTVFSVGHMAFMLVLPKAANPIAGGGGLVLFLVILTQFNDVAQYVWGKLFGRHKIIPKVSPKKTWEGFLGGFVTTVFVAYLLAPLLTFFDSTQAILAGGIIGLSGFMGDLNMSAIKRDLEIKDTSELIPGHGGILDRLDSLTFTAPLFFHFTYYFIPWNALWPGV